MSEFSADWLAAREIWDHRARSSEILEDLNHWLAGRREVQDPVGIIDLGCGTGSTRRYLAPRLSAEQRWTLVDGDRTLLDIAAATGDAGDTGNNGAIGATTVALDLRAADISTLVHGNDLVTTSALLDLVSETWLDRLWDAMIRQGAGLLAGLTYDGRLAFSPAHPLDAVVRDLVNRHQRGDKGFGPALGPVAASVMAKRALGAGWRARSRRSDWMLSADRDGSGLRMLIDGWVAAATELSPGMEDRLNNWRADRLAEKKLTVIVGHRDQLILPPISTRSS